MNLDDLRNKLIAAARAHPPSERVPYAFEKRILAHLRGSAARRKVDLWAQALWRAAGSCVALMLLLGALTWFAPVNSTSAGDLAQDFDNMVFAAAEQETSAEPLQ